MNTIRFPEDFNINMLWLIDLFLIALFFFMIWLGRKRGFIKSVSGLVSLLGAWFCADRFSFLLKDFLLEKVFGPMMLKYVKAALSSALSGIDTTVNSAVDSLVEKAGELRERLQAAGLFPTSISVDIKGALPESMDFSVLSDELSRSIAQPIAERLSSVAGYMLVFLAVFVLLLIAFCFIDLVAKLPILDRTNQILGGILGFFKGIAYAWIAAQVCFLVLGILYANGTLSETQTPGPIYGFLTQFGISGGL